MTIVKMHVPITRYSDCRVSHDINDWMQKNVEHWHCYREGAFLVIDFFGLEHEQDAIAFKLKFGC